jgi:isopentenyl diphosphate isomerase/L-lactate dehydrogenase-like FMN-dependent dehydrogenase
MRPESVSGLPTFGDRFPERTVLKTKAKQGDEPMKFPGASTMRSDHAVLKAETSDDRGMARRQFLRYLAGSPLIAGSVSMASVGALLASLPDPVLAQSYDVLRAPTAPLTADGIITSPDQALNVMDFEAAARKALTDAGAPAHFGYLATGVDDDATLRANHEDYQKIRIQVRRLIDARKVDTSCTVLGDQWRSPIFMSPVSSQAAFNPEAEADVADAKAAKAKGHQMILSTVGSRSIEDVNAAHGSPVWYMLYPTDDWNVTQAMVKRAEKAGSPVLVLTVDRQGGRNTETLFRARRMDNRDCQGCHQGGFQNEVSRKPMFDGLDVSKVTNLYDTGMTWDLVKRLQGVTRMKMVLKGIMTGEDAAKAVKYGIDGVIVSNHGGRAEESLRSTISALPDVVKAVSGHIPVLIDGGVRRGTDVLKALALGATAVGIGRPYCWGLAAFGQPGVETVLAILQREFETIMKQVGATNLRDITRTSVAV